MNTEGIAVSIVITEIVVFQVNSSHVPIKKTVINGGQRQIRQSKFNN